MDDERELAHCNQCGGNRYHNSLFKTDKYLNKETREGNEVEWNDYYDVLECCGCGNIKFCHEHYFSEFKDEEGNPIATVNYYPAAIYRPFPKWLNRMPNDWNVTALLKEIYRAIQNEAPSLALMGVRAVIESLMIKIAADNGSFNRNLSTCVEKGVLSERHKEYLEDVLEAGHASIHRNFIPSTEQLYTCLDVMENFIETIFVLPNEGKRLRKEVPERNNGN